MIFYVRPLTIGNLIKKCTIFRLSFILEKCILDWFLLFYSLALFFVKIYAKIIKPNYLQK